MRGTVAKEQRQQRVKCGEATGLLLQRLPHLLDARLLDEVGQLKRRLLYSSLALQVLPLEAPVARNRHRVPGGLEVDQQLGLLGRHVVHLHHVGTCHQLHQEEEEEEEGERW